MRSSNFGFKEQDVGNIDAIIEAINELVRHDFRVEVKFESRPTYS